MADLRAARRAIQRRLQPAGARHGQGGGGALRVTLPYAAFNGGNVVNPAGGLLQAHRLAAETAQPRCS